MRRPAASGNDAAKNSDADEDDGANRDPVYARAYAGDERR